MLNLTITGLTLTIITLSMLNAISKPEKLFSKLETGLRLLSVFITICTFAWVTNIQQYYILHTITKQTIIQNENSTISAEFFKEKILNELPPQTWEGIAIITLKQSIPEKDNNYETYGVYYPLPHKIELKATSLDNMKTNMAHEAAHWYWFDKMTNTQRSEWTKLYKNTKKFSSDYAKTSEKEDFAETVSLIITHQNVTTDQEKIDFIIKNYLKPLHLNYETPNYDPSVAQLQQ